MALNSKLIQRITKTTSADVVHSTGYADAQNAGYLGVAQGANQSFEDRKELEKNRQNIQAYRQASVAQQRNFMPKAMSVEEKALADAQKAIYDAGGDDVYLTRQEMNSKLNAGGIRKYDRAAKGVSGAKEVSKTRGFGRMSAAELRNNRMAQAEHRAAQVDRFAGGVRTFEGGPKKFTGGTGITPRSGR